MSDFDDERKVFETYFKSKWNETTYPVQYENADFAAPIDRTWIRFCISDLSTNPVALGGDKVRTMGYVYVTIFTPKGKGTTAYKQAGDAFAAIFDLINLQMSSGYASFQTTNTKTIGDHSGFLMAEARCAYHRDTDKVPVEVAIDGGIF